MKNPSSTNKSVKKVGKKSTQKRKKPLPGKPMRIPGADKGKVIIKPDFVAPLPEFE
jgi:hypothetical protein